MEAHSQILHPVSTLQYSCWGYNNLDEAYGRKLKTYPILTLFYFALALVSTCSRHKHLALKSVSSLRLETLSFSTSSSSTCVHQLSCCILIGAMSVSGVVLRLFKTFYSLFIYNIYIHYSYIIWSRWVPDQFWLATSDHSMSLVGFKCFYLHFHVVVNHLIATWSKNVFFWDQIADY